MDKNVRKNTKRSIGVQREVINPQMLERGGRQFTEKEAHLATAKDNGVSVAEDRNYGLEGVIGSRKTSLVITGGLKQQESMPGAATRDNGTGIYSSILECDSLLIDLHSGSSRNPY